MILASQRGRWRRFAPRSQVFWCAARATRLARPGMLRYPSAMWRNMRRRVGSWSAALVATCSLWLPGSARAQGPDSTDPGSAAGNPSSAAPTATPAHAAPPADYAVGPVYEPPPPPPGRPPEAAGRGRPTLSVRLDPLNWLLDGRLGLELEAELLSFLSVELVPMFVVNDVPPTLDQAFDGVVSQHSNGIDALAGSSIAAGFWLNGTPLKGTVVRAVFTNYALTYRATDARGELDEVSHTERRLYGFIGNHSVWGVFTLTGGFGLGVELNEQRRCFPDGSMGPASSDCTRRDLLIALNRARTARGNLNSATHPVELMFRLSLGVTF